ncbi:hypothetical protein EJ02DRAFT_339304 [Clathrospora elynae]|uniref:Zn(2)-C6 fungal-type domain-containing protein n=1 Tax=Clathrospora elynae TaxID=706981 RepID=A0A6A5SZ20_9PLEO|nr:hypothetical protein EJ02DRAFT_339304 [Clathrospora elynae]
MNDGLSPIEGIEVDRRSSSPKRKKIRQKYAPKACVSCRRSKLKCSGENPCQRCIDNGKRCFFSEDQTAAEALQNLSRPPPAHAPQSSLAGSHGNGGGASRGNVLPRDDDTERRASDASVRGMSMETRMARIETMMEALMRDRGLTMTPIGSIEREDGASDGFRGDAAFSMPALDPINPALAFMGPHSMFNQELPNSTQPAIPALNPPFVAEPSHLIQLGDRALPFPSPEEYQQYLYSFFTDIHLSHPCIDEADFRSHAEHMLASTIIPSGESHFLALNYIIFACCDLLLKVTPADASKPLGWPWSEMADHLLDKKSLLSGGGGLTLIQCLLFQALYHTFVDMPGLAYNTIGLASRLVFQHSLHQQSTWTNISIDQAYVRMGVFWNVFIADRLISLSCGRPYTIQEADIHVESPMDFFTRQISSEQFAIHLDMRHYASQYLNYMALWARYIDERGLDGHTRDAIDSQITHFLEHELPGLRIPYVQLDATSEPPLKAFLIQRKTDFVLWGFRPAITSLKYEGGHAAHFSHLALCTVNRMAALAHDIRRPFSLRGQMVSSLAGALLVLCSLLVRDATTSNQAHVEAFRTSLAMLNDLGYSHLYARRVLSDFQAIVAVVEGLIDDKDVPANAANLFPYKSSSPSLRLANIKLESPPMSAEGTFPIGDSGSTKPSEFGSDVLWL